MKLKIAKKDDLLNKYFDDSEETTKPLLSGSTERKFRDNTAQAIQ